MRVYKMPIIGESYKIPITGEGWQRLYLDGLDGCVIVEHPKINIKDQITIEVALIFRQIKKGAIISKKDEYNICLEDSGRLTFSFGKGRITSNTSLVINQFYHLGCVYDGDYFHIYIFDGLNEIEEKHKFDNNKYSIGNLTDVNIGRSYNNKYYSNIEIFWLSIMADALSQSDIDGLRRRFKPINKFNCQMWYDFRYPLQVKYDLFKSQKIILERLFGEDWFKKDIYKKVNHPAYNRWLLSEKLIKQNGLIYPEDKMSDIAPIIIDNMIIATYSEGDLDRFIMGNFSNCDKKELKIICSVIEDPENFFDKLTELSYVAWHLLKGNKVVHREMDGYADIKININNLDLPFVAECKRIKADTKDKAFGRVINKANNQIKKLKEECYGLVVINISDKIKNSEISDKIPEEVERIINIVQNTIKSDNSCVSGVLLTWDEYKLFGIPGESTESTFFYRKMVTIVRHLHPKKELPANENWFNGGGIYMWKIGWKV